jgi:lipoprotein-anchoring transpeptidase ErfK/SrfK
VWFTAQAATVHRPVRARRMPARPPITLSADDVNNAGLTPDLGPKANGSSVVRAQILLDRAHFSCGEIDGYYGSNLSKMVVAFQRSRNLEANGNLDGSTWNALNQDRAPALVTYQITPQDVAGPFYKIPADMMAQAKLPGLGYSSPLEELGERFHSNPKVLELLNTGKHLDQAGELLLVPNVIVPPPGAADRIVVSKSESSVTVLDAQGHVLASYAATIGSRHDPLPIGEWKVTGVQRNPVFHYNPNLFWDAKPLDGKAAIKPGPNNPVGMVWIALTKEHYGIHGTPEPGMIGHTASHGCIRLTNWDAMELAGMVKPGTPVTCQE